MTETRSPAAPARPGPGGAIGAGARENSTGADERADGIGAKFTQVREAHPGLDHLIRCYGRYAADGGDRLAAAVTFYWFLSLFPILLLAISLVGFAYGDQASVKVSGALSGFLPAQLVTTISDTLTHAKGRAGLLGGIGLLLSGLGWVDGLRESIRSVWHQNVQAGNILTRKLLDIGILAGLLATITASIAVTGAVTGASGWLLGGLGVANTWGAKLLTGALGYALALGADAGVFVYMFTRLPRVHHPLARVWRSAVLGAVGFELVKTLGAVYVAHTTSRGQATYGTFAVVVGLLLLLNLLSRVILLAAAYAVTAAGDSDVSPSGTASVANARASGIPEAYAQEGDPTHPDTLTENGAPTPLRRRVNETPVQAYAAGAHRTGAHRTGAHAADRGDRGERIRAESPPPHGVRIARLAGLAGLGMVGVGIAAVGHHALTTVGILRR